MILNDPSTRLRFYIVLGGIVASLVTPSGYWSKTVLCAGFALLSVITTFTELASNSDKPVSRPVYLVQIVAALYTSTIFLLTAANVIVDSPIRPLLILLVIFALGLQVWIK